MTSVHLISVAAVCMSLMAEGVSSEQISLFQELLNQYMLELVDMRGYADCSVTTLASFCIHNCEAVRISAVFLLQKVVERMRSQARQFTFLNWTRFYLTVSIDGHSRNHELARLQAAIRQEDPGLLEDWEELAIDSEQVSVNFQEFGLLEILSLSPEQEHLVSTIVVSVFILAFPESFSEKLMKLVCHDLIRFVLDVSPLTHGIQVSMCTDILGRGVGLWKFHTREFGTLISSLLRVVDHDPALDGGSSVAIIAASKALVELACAEPRTFVGAIAHEARKGNTGALGQLVKVFRKAPVSMLGVLPLTVDVIIKGLDPSDTALRKALLKKSTQALFTLTKLYPQVAFHQGSQLFAVGSDKSLKCAILIYDLRTATKLNVVEGHTADVNCVSFSEKGDMIASYSAQEDPPSVRVWKVSSHVFLSGFLGLQVKSMKCQGFHPAEPVTPTELLQNIKLIWTTAKSFDVIREDKSKYSIQL